MDLQYTGPDYGVVFGFLIIGAAMLFAGVATEFISLSGQAGETAALGILLVFAAGMYSLMTSRTVVSVLRDVETRVSELRG